MKKIILALAAIFAMTMNAQAQDEDRPAGGQMPNKEEMVQRMTDMMAETLGLTADQKEAVLAINTKYGEILRPQGRPRGPQEGSEVEGDEKGVKKVEEKVEGKKEEIEGRVEYKEALKGVLTEEQYKKYEEMEKSMRRPGGHRGGPRPDGPLPEGAPQAE